MWVAIASKRSGTIDFWDPETMSEAYTRATRPDWVTGDDGYTKAQMSAEVGEALCEKYPGIVPASELPDPDEDDADADADADDDDDAAPADVSADN